MSRPRRSDQVREALIHAGIEHISTHGYHGTGIKQVLDSVNVPKGSFYNFFGSKEAFVAEVIKTYSDDMHCQLNDFVQGSGKHLSVQKQLVAIHRFSLEKIVQSDYLRSCLIGSLSTEIAAGNSACGEQLTLATQRWLAFLVERITKGQCSGEIRDDLPAEQLANLYWATWQGSLIKLHMYKDSEAALQDIKAMLTLFTVPAIAR